MTKTEVIANYFALREKRLALNRQADELEQQEKDILYAWSKDFEDSGEKAVSEVGTDFTLKATRKDVTVVVDWTTVLDHIRETGEVDLLQKRLTESAVKARWDSGKEVPGVDKTHKWDVKVTRNAS